MVSGIINREIFENDPTAHSLENDGVSKVTNTAALQYELATFVCEGEYEKGLYRILDTYLSHLDQQTQPSAWVSGFYGSGKSHLVKILEALWTNKPLPSGQCPRDMVNLPSDLREQFLELSSHAKRIGGLWSASGMLSESGNQSVRVLILGIVYKAAGLSSNYGRARFRLWVRKHGWEKEIVTRVSAEGLDVEEEFNQYLVSPIIADAVWELSGAQSMDADTAQDRWGHQFDQGDISIDDFKDALREVLQLQSEDGAAIPLTLIVLDEAQQFINDSGTRAQALQEAVERIQSAFESKVLVVATGQAALNTTPNLQKLQGRFTVNVMLSDKDVEQVVRQVVLRKNSTVMPNVREMVKQTEGEIDRHLQSTKIGPRSEDKAVLAEDYPLLPTRSRFWSSLLHELDPSGTSGQLRTQLRVVHSANVHVADEPLGHVIPGDYIYDQLHAGLQQSGALPRDVSNLINDQQDGTEDGALRARLIQLIFLIERLPTADLNDVGLNATPENLADLLVEDLTQGSDDLRRRIPDLLRSLEDDGRIMRSADGSYAIQTGESLKWQSQFQQERQSLLANPGPLGDVRTRALEELVREQAKTLRRTHGQTKTAREITFHFGNETPDGAGADSSVVVWVRDEWNSSEKTVREDARAAGEESAILFVFLPQRHASDLQTAIANFEAAKRTLDVRGASQDSLEGQQVADAIRARMQENERRFRGLLGDVVADPRVYQGGAAEVDGTTLKDKIQAAFDSSLKRLFPHFANGDHPNWGQVFSRATQGSADALKAVGHTGDDNDHAVVRATRSQIPGGTGTSWAAMRKTFKNSPYGWPQDAIDGAVAVLVSSGAVNASRNGSEVRGKDLTRQQASATTLFGEQAPITKMEMLQARRVYQAMHGAEATDEDVRAGTRSLVEELVALQRSAGGEPPLPMNPMPATLSELQNLVGNQLIKSIAGHAEQLDADIKAWRQRAEEIGRRLENWKTADRLASHAQLLDGFDQIRAKLYSIRENRQLLDNLDPLQPVKADLGNMLRSALQTKFDAFDERIEAGLAELTATDEWARLNEHQQNGILAAQHLQRHRPPAISSDRDLLTALERQSLTQWDDKIAALDSHIQRAHAEAIRLLEPSVVAVSLEKPLMRKPADVERWIEKTRESLMQVINEGHSVRIT